MRASVRQCTGRTGGTPTTTPDTLHERLEVLLDAMEHHHPFEGLDRGASVRADLEMVVAEYAELATSAEGRQRFLAAADAMRSPDIGLSRFRTAGIGPASRHRWPPDATGDDRRPFAVPDPGSDRFRRSVPDPGRASDERPDQTAPEPSEPFLEADPSIPKRPLDYDAVLTLHISLVGDGLVYTLDAGLRDYIYGADNRDRVVGRAFSDYAYDADTRAHHEVLLGPVVRPGVRHLIDGAAAQIHDWFDRHDRAGLDAGTRANVALDLDRAFASADIIDRIRSWTRERGLTMADICVVLVPDMSSYLLPLPFLGLSSGHPIVGEVGGVATALSLVMVKRQASSFHWTTEPNLRGREPRCTFFASAAGFEDLALTAEETAVTAGFGTDRVAVYRRASTAEFAANCTAADVLWFGGHGSFSAARGVRTSGGVIPMPNGGLQFEDGTVSMLDLIATSDWNLKTQWLTVANSCSVGRNVIHGPNAIGLISGLQTVGAIATVAAAWPVRDQVATAFATHLAASIPSMFGRRDFPRARAFATAIQECLAAGIDPWELAPYNLWGLP